MLSSLLGQEGLFIVGLSQILLLELDLNVVVFTEINLLKVAVCLVHNISGTDVILCQLLVKVDWTLLFKNRRGELSLFFAVFLLLRLNELTFL